MWERTNDGSQMKGLELVTMWFVTNCNQEVARDLVSLASVLRGEGTGVRGNAVEDFRHPGRVRLLPNRVVFRVPVDCGGFQGTHGPAE